MEAQIQIKINKPEKDLIKEAANFLSLPYSIFCRTASIEKAREVLKEEKNGIKRD